VARAARRGISRAAPCCRAEGHVAERREELFHQLCLVRFIGADEIPFTVIFQRTVCEVAWMRPAPSTAITPLVGISR
jgi:hypothetical protein